MKVLILADIGFATKIRWIKYLCKIGINILFIPVL